ncbi:hypothetical protein [Sphingomonas sp. CROZ-RG-20F-R02-07]|uniref:hypothetical protein n=1 Tax=Sphingomonas sp. CROZ-RG-20F-R02-07 TaxID=2914832 RepID=UPI001F593C4A|nr:hypothetical protein [Sphingomonas sp. CROZ-RG-20F-R02-07]
MILALKALVAVALPDAKVRGFDVDSARPASIPAGGVVIGHPGAAGDPQIDLSPACYTYNHPITLEISPSVDADQAAALDVMLGDLGRAIVADRTLGGLCIWLEAQAPDEDDTPSGEGSQRWATFDIVASYSTTDPLN